MTVSPSFRTFILEQLGRTIPGIRARNMFGGVGIYGEELFFALIDDDTLYFKVDESNRPDYQARGMGPFQPYGEDGETMGYYIGCRKICSRTPRCSVNGLRRRSMWHAGRKANLPARPAPKKEDPMRRVRYSVAASLDGYIADADGRFDWIPEDQTVDFAAIFARVDTILLGRRSFELVRQAGAPGWGPNMRVYVFSRTLRPADYPDVTVVVGDNFREVLAGLRAESGQGEIWLWGGGQLFSSLLAAEQVDAVEVTIVPVLLGGGVPLAAPGFNRTKLVLRHTHQYPTGMISLIYDVDPGVVKRELIS